MVGIIEAIKKGFGTAGKSLGLVSVLIIFNLIGNIASMPFAVAPGQTPAPGMLAGTLIFTIIFVLISVFVQGGAIALIRDCIKEGKMKLASFASYGAKYYVRLLGLGALIVLIIGIVAIVAALMIGITAPLNNDVITAVAIVIAIAIGVIGLLLYFVPLSLSPYALISEDLGIIGAMKRGLDVARKPFTRVFMLILLFIILVLISLGVGLLFGFLVGIISAVVPAAASKILMAVVTSVINGYLGVVMIATFMVYYFDLAANTVKKV